MQPVALEQTRDEGVLTVTTATVAVGLALRSLRGGRLAASSTASFAAFGCSFSWSAARGGGRGGGGGGVRVGAGLVLHGERRVVRGPRAGVGGAALRRVHCLFRVRVCVRSDSPQLAQFGRTQRPSLVLDDALDLM